MTFNDLIITGNQVEEVNDNVTTSEPSDVFKFEITEERSINLLLTGLSGDADLALYRDDGNGTLQTFGFYSDELISASVEASSYDDHINRWSQPGTYFAVVEQYSSISPISYDLFVSASRQPGELTGPPNTLAEEEDKNLGTLSYDQEFHNKSVGFREQSDSTQLLDNEVGDTSDLYYFTLPEGHTVDITLSHLRNGNADIRLIDDSLGSRPRVVEGPSTHNEVVDTSTNEGTHTDTISRSTPGDYYLQVYPVTETDNIQYNLTFDYT